jgi:hypothetical protein
VVLDELGDTLLDFSSAFRESLADLGQNSGDFEAGDGPTIIADFHDPVAEGPAGVRHFVLVDFPGVSDGGDHFELSQGTPSLDTFVPSGIGSHKVGMDLLCGEPIYVKLANMRPGKSDGIGG